MTKAKIIKDAKELGLFLDSKKASDISILDVSEITPIADVFIIASAESFIHSKALEDYSIEFLEKKKYDRLNGRNIFPENPWILLDYGSIIVHIFKNDARNYYQLEKLWFDAVKIELELK